MSIRGNGTQVVLGAGKWYVNEWTSGALDLSTLCVEANIIGYTSGGATLEYNIETYTIEDDIGMVRRTFKTKGNATMKTGLLTFDVAALSKLLSMGTLSSDNGKQILKLGGGKESLKKYSVGFEYNDEQTGERLRIGMVATNTASLTLAFTKDKETVVDVEFTAESNGVDETIVVFEEENAGSGSVISAAVYNVTAPVKSATPQATHDGAAGYTAAIAWTPNDGSFAGNTAYKATVTLTAAAGYTFDGNFNANDVVGLPATTGTTPPASAVHVTRASATSVVIEVTYAKTAA